jgi:hypothetical protein
MVVLYVEDHMKYVNTLCGQNAEYKVFGTHSYHCDLKV